MQLPPSPNAAPLWQAAQWILDPVRFMESSKRKGDIFTAYVGMRFHPMIFVNHPEGIQQMLTSDTKELTAPGGVNGILRPLLGNYSLILLEGAEHRRQRQLLMPPFHGDRLRAYAQLICDLTEEALDKLKPGEPFIARELMQDISLQVILHAVFGMGEGDRYQQLRALTCELFALFDSSLAASLLFVPALQKDLGAWSPWGKFCRLRQQIDELLYAEIRDRRREQAAPGEDMEVGDRNDILSLLMAAKDEAGEGMTPEELRDELLTLLFAGHETTATAMAWSMYWAHLLPEVGQKLQAELDAADFSDPMALYKLPYLTAVTQETLRIYPVGMLTFPRVVAKPTEILGHHLEPDALLVGCIYLVHHREDLYPEPQKFKPERFLERQYSAYEYLPFGGGVRRCIGAALAQMEMRLVLATVLSQYEFDLAERGTVRPLRRGVTLGPTGGVRMVMVKRRVAGGGEPAPNVPVAV